jgi:hypothetical protein
MSVYSAHEPLPRDIPIVQVGLVDNDLAKNFAAEIALKADVRETLCAFLFPLSNPQEVLLWRSSPRTASKA